MDMTIGRRDDDKNQNQDSLNEQNSNRNIDAKGNLLPHNNNNNTISSSMNMPRNHRRLNKWMKFSQDGETVADEISNAAMESVQDEGSLLYQSLKTMETHLLEADKPEDSLENSSEKDIYLRDRPATGIGIGTGTGVEDEQDSDEDININDDDQDSNGHDPSLLNDLDKNRKPTLTLIDELSGVDSNSMPVTNNQETMLSYKSQQLIKHQQNTTPKGLTTWSAVQVSPSASSGFGGMPHKGSIQKISSSLGLSLASTTSKPITTADIVTKDKGRPTMFDSSMMTTTMMPPIRVETGFMSNSLSNSNTRVPNRPHNNNIKPPIPRRKPVGIRKPPKYVKAPLDQVHATMIGSDETHDIYVVKTVTPDSDAELKTSSSSIPDESPMTRPPWPFMTATKRSPFSKIKTTARPVKNAYLKRTQIPILTLKTPTTTTTTTPKPKTTTVYYRTPAQSLMSAFPISFTNSMTFYDFIRTQILPRMGLGVISLMASSPLILTLLVNTLGRRKKRDLNGSSSKDEVKNVNFADKLPKVLKELAKKWEADLANNNFKFSAFSTQSQSERLRTETETETETEDADDDDDEGPSTAENYSTTSSPAHNKRYRRRRLKKTNIKKTNSQKILVTEEDEKPTGKVPTTVATFLFNRNINEPGTSPLRVYNVAAMLIQQLFASVRELFNRRQDQQSSATT